MSIKQIALLIGLTAFCFAVVILAFFYGPAQRTYASPPQIVSVLTSDQIVTAWEARGVKGRIVICFTRYLNAHESKESKDTKATELGMNHGILRRVFHVTPDNAWDEIRGALSMRNDMRPTSEGFIGIFNDGRVYITPLSRFSPVAEKALIIIEPKVWSRTELQQIGEMLKSGKITSDLIVIIRGSEEDAITFRRVSGY
jgi:hypothetical protein